jgi:SAM-dependent methyltransferase
MKTQESWYVDWQDSEHARHLDARSTLPSRSLIRNYESFSDVLLLNERLEALRNPTVLEVGCATGEFYRYLRLKTPRASYAGLDISRPAVSRARKKYPQGQFFVSDPAQSLPEVLKAHRLNPQWQVVYSKDVMHHQTDPFGFLAQLLGICSGSLILRTRTRDKGPTLLDPEQSCQYHYQGWMPFIVLNLDELIGQIQRHAPGSEIRMVRNRTILGGKENRFLPKDCYLPETGTAETSVGVFRDSSHGNRVRVIDRAETPARHSLRDRVALRLRRRARGS